MDIYKKQMEDYDKNVANKPILEENSKKRANSNLAIKSLNKELMEKINDLSSSIVRLEGEILSQNEDISFKNQNIKEMTIEKEELLNEVNYLKKKHECLLHEKVLNYTPQKKPEESEEKNDENTEKNNENHRKTLKKTMDIKNLENLEEEMKKLKEKLKNQEITIET